MTSKIFEYLRYEKATGRFFWNKSPNKRIRIDAEAGGLNKPKNRWYICFDGKLYLRSHLVWLFEIGRWPTQDICHKDGDKLNDHISNLEEADRSHNKKNLNDKIYSNNTSGHRGVQWHKAGKGWAAVWYENGKQRVKIFSTNKYPDAKQRASDYRKQMEEIHGYYQ